MSLKLVLLTIGLFAATVTARRFCMTDDDCSGLGDITCQYSGCGSWGICGCQRGYVSRFMGSEKKYQCLLLKKIGESCSIDGSKGVCGPDDSECDEGKCQCTSEISGWDGEKCFSDNELSDHYGETCSASLGMCSSAGSNCDEGTGFDYLSHSYEMNTCACAVGERLTLPNYFDTSPFVGRREPTCTSIKVGEQCMRDTDCGNIGGGTPECVNNVCQCEDGYEPYSDGSSCSSADLLGQGDKCYEGDTGSTEGTCGLHMFCGDVCTPDNYYDSTVDKTCNCMAGYSGSSCTAVTVGTACSGDMMCKGIGMDALCLDGACVAGAAAVSVSLFGLFFAVFALFL